MKTRALVRLHSNSKFSNGCKGPSRLVRVDDTDRETVRDGDADIDGDRDALPLIVSDTVVETDGDAVSDGVIDAE